MVHTGPHYYVISLGRQSNALFEAFRDTLIDIKNGGFPFASATPKSESADTSMDDRRLRDALKLVDERFCHFYDEEPMKLVVVGERDLIDEYSTIATHRDAIVGCVSGDFTETSLRDLGKIVWPVVKEEMSGQRAAAMFDLRIAERNERIATGIESVSLWASEGVGSRLLVEEDYVVKGSVSRVGSTVTVSQDVDVTEVLDDVVDVVIDQVRQIGGTVVFVPSGTLEKQKKIVLILEK